MSKKIIASILGVTAVTLISKGLGFLREICLASAFGTSVQSDAFIMARSIISVISVMVLGSMTTTLIPIYTEYITTKKKDKQDQFLNAIYSLFIVLMGLVAIFGLVFTKQIVFLFAPNFSSEATQMTIKILRILFPTIVLSGIIQISNARLQINQNFLIPAAISYPQNIFMIGTLLFFTGTFGVVGLAVGMALGTLAEVALQVPFLRNLNYQFHFNLDLREPGIRKIGFLIIPILIGNGIQQINTTIDRILASGLPAGSVAALNFSNRLVLFVVGLLGAVIDSIYYTSMSHYHTSGDTDAFKQMLNHTINLMCMFIFPATIGFMVLRLPIIQLVFQRGAFDASASSMTATALFFYAIGLLGYSLRDVLSRAFYSIQDTKTAMINGSIGVVLNIILSITLVQFMGIGGLALGTSASGLITTFLLLISLRKKIGDFGSRNMVVTFLKIVVMSIVMGICVHFSYGVLMDRLGSNTISVLVSIVLGVGVYGVLALFSGIEEVKSVLSMVTKRLKR